MAGEIGHLFTKKSSAISPDKVHIIPNGYDPDDFNSLVPGSKKLHLPLPMRLALPINIRWMASLVPWQENLTKNLTYAFIGRRDQKSEHKIKGYKDKINLSLKAAQKQLNQELMWSDALYSSFLIYLLIKAY
ncbi:MAG: hypothetical protein U5L96_02265 [Owenweeksia sp.]|nr:hypothetical protein [Owenweeksia sp.]